MLLLLRGLKGVKSKEKPDVGTWISRGNVSLKAMYLLLRYGICNFRKSPLSHKVVYEGKYSRGRGGGVGSEGFKNKFTILFLLRITSVFLQFISFLCNFVFPSAGTVLCHKIFQLLVSYFNPILPSYSQ